MLIHPDLMLTQFHDRERELIAEADRYRLLNAARRRRRAQAKSHEDSSREAVEHQTVRHQAVAPAETTPAARGRPDGTLATCERVAAPAR
jgi:hypothetical protein